MTCALCPRNCAAARTPDHPAGVCRSPSLPVVARSMLHQWEEPCLTGQHGAGAVFFSGCSLRCVYCQNREISRQAQGRTLDPDQLRALFRDLIGQGAACLDLVTPTHFAPAISDALGNHPWPVPVVWNSSGYESVSTLRTLEGKINVFLPDLKYALSAPAGDFSAAPDYFDRAAPAILEMFRQVGPYRLENGLLRSGVLIRHLLLPGQLENTRRVIDWVAASFRPGDVLFSLMRQYTPQPGAQGLLARRVTGGEYRAAVEYLQNCGVSDGYLQEREAASASFTPDF